MSTFLQASIDPAIVSRAQRGDLKAHELVYRTYAKPVYNLAIRILRDPHQAEEVMQDTFIEVLRKIDSYRGDAPVGAWIRRIAANKALMVLRSAWHRLATPLEAEHDAPTEDHSGVGEGIRAVESAELERQLAQLSPVTRAVIWLYDVEGYTHKEIATMMGKTASFSKSQLSRGHEKLRRMMADDGEVETCMQVSNSY
ncbi:MAG: RNA polymerase sigma factor [Gammaproteobacteria bacterium]|nr:RNA polymerase sigma factor [Gammaproteobacteria bacterium]